MISIATQLGIEPQPAPAVLDTTSLLGQIHAIAFPKCVKRERRVVRKVGHRMAQILHLLKDGLRHSTAYLGRKCGMSMNAVYQSLWHMEKAGFVRKAGYIKRGKNYITLWQKAGEVKS